MDRQRVAAKTLWEDAFGYSRAVRIGNVVKVSGTTAMDEAGAVVGDGDVYAQAVYAIQKIEKALAEVGATLEDVVQTRMFVTNMDDWQGLARAHSEFFDGVRPAATLVEITRLVAPEFLVESEVEAIISA